MNKGKRVDKVEKKYVQVIPTVNHKMEVKERKLWSGRKCQKNKIQAEN